MTEQRYTLGEDMGNGEKYYRIYDEKENKKAITTDEEFAEKIVNKLNEEG